ncbi:DUF732 domain-containing protein [Mycobacterium riyadhense]|uniref:DUF732 domain-containing protein n=1 Tax=Mycobacterium riyadhense TaxID=486698 RepID=A0A1X2DG92_9MYCO|nr:DUF732 domain-containing protein [Mycobacterium riyadhense]MCV7146349.1 DUF732 domain-containing protein [Mycobacterium riyadhense]ORW87193.1 hypothetical protein AWC22_09515 [Mycobacterium riyadhense]VTO94732.1 hypothetical protein BIN_B_00205 [Mycobacterium riyadhense]
MRLIVALVGVAAVIGVAAPAHADGNDDRFLATLRQAGLTYQNADGAIATAKAACGLVQRGRPMADVVKDVQTSNPGLDAESAAKFTAIAANSYCPETIQRY